MFENIKTGNLALSFFLELWAFVSIAYWGFRTGGNIYSRIALGILVPLLTIIVWSIFLAPKSSRKLDGWKYRSLKLLIFGFSAVALWWGGSRGSALLLGGAVIVNQLLEYAFQQR